MIQYTWIINALDCLPKKGQMLDVVSIVHWTRFAKQGDIEVSNYGTMSCGQPIETDFTAYADLTYEQVCSWLDAGLDVRYLDVNLNIQIDNIINPPIVNLPLPWADPVI